MRCCRRVYDSNLVMKFLAAATSKEVMYQMADEFQNLNIMYMYDGCSRAWHYDGTDTVITLLLQKPVKVQVASCIILSVSISMI